MEKYYYNWKIKYIIRKSKINKILIKSKVFQIIDILMLYYGGLYHKEIWIHIIKK